MLRLDFTGLDFSQKKETFTYGVFESTFVVQPFPASMAEYEIDRQTGRTIVTGRSLCVQFQHCFVSADPLIDGNGNKISLTTANKQAIFDNRLRDPLCAAIVNFVLMTSTSIADRMDADLGNLSAGQSGTSTQNGTIVTSAAESSETVLKQ